MPDEPGRPRDEEVASALARLRAVATEEETPPEDPAAQPEPRSSSPKGWSPGPRMESALIVLGYGLAWGVFAFSLFVYPGWRRYLELLEFLLSWASNAP